MNSTSISATSAPRVWIYARYSTDQQTQKSIDDQLAECHRYCARMGWNVERVLTDAEMIGFIDQRPGYRELLGGVEAALWTSSSARTSIVWRETANTALG